MDKMDTRVLTQNQKILLGNLATVKPWKLSEPTDRFTVDRRNVRLSNDGDVHAASAAPEVLPAPVNVEEALVESLLYDVPKDMLAAARQILKGQMKTKAEPRKGLETMKRPDGTSVMCDPLESYLPVSTDIVEDAQPLPILE